MPKTSANKNSNGTRPQKESLLSLFSQIPFDPFPTVCVDHHCRQPSEKDDYVASVVKSLDKKMKNCNLRRIMCVVQHRRTDKIGSTIADLCGKPYECNWIAAGKKDVTDFYDDMASFKKGVPWRVLHACMFLLDEEPAFDSDNLAKESIHMLFNADIRQINHDTFEARMSSMPQKKILQALLNELGYYFTIARATDTDLRKFCNLMYKILPPYFDHEDCLLACYRFTSEEWEEEPGLQTYYEETVYQEAFLGYFGLYGVFFVYLKLIIKFIIHSLGKKNPGLEEMFVDHHMDVRVPFQDMVKFLKFPQSDVITAALPLVLNIQGITPVSCRCQERGPHSIISIKKLCDLAQINEVPTHKPKRNRYYLMERCGNVECFLKYYKAAIPRFADTVKQVMKTKDSKNQQKLWAQARDELGMSTLLVDLMKFQIGYVSGDQKWLGVGLGSLWSTWNQDQEIEQSRLCWNCYAGGRLLLCSSCRRARYCNRYCAEKHWKKHKNMCRDRQIHRILPSVTWDED